jgi:hypothetical protein
MLMPELYMNDWPPFSPEDQRRREATIVAVKLMANAVQTVPNAGGVSQIEASIMYGYREKVSMKPCVLSPQDLIYCEM